MNYRVLYRKYRPDSFESVIGQDNTINILRDSIINNKISHAYIFSGPRGTGKTSTAKIFAKAINCLNPDNGSPCGKCENCINFSQSSDIYEIDAASNNGVDQVREIIDNIKLTPISMKYKVYIIDEVHMLSQNAFNALLLTLEEPPGHVAFILATTDIQEVPITVLSRCQRLEFKRIGIDLIEKHLKEVSKEEKIDITDEALEEIADYSDGGMRDALSILDQLSKEGKKIELSDVLDNIGLVSDNQVETLIDNINKGDVESIISFSENLHYKAYDFKTIIKKMIHSIKKHSVSSLNNFSTDRLSFEDYKNLCFDLADCLTRVNINIDSYDLLEMILLKYTKVMQADVPKKEQESSKKEKIISREIISKPKKLVNTRDDYYPNNDFVKIRINNCFVNAKKDYLINVTSSWNNFKNYECTNKYKIMISDSGVVLCSDQYMIIKVDYSDTAKNINDNIFNIETEFNNYNKSNYKLAAIDESSWEKEMNNYKNNIKNNIKYQLIDEEVVESNSLNDIFKETNIEIK